MDSEKLKQLIGLWKWQYRQLLDESERLLGTLDTCSPEDTAELTARRQKIVDELQNIGPFLRACREAGLGEADRCLLDAFSSYQETVTGRILELDALAIALVNEKLLALKGDMAALSTRKVMLNAYEGNGRGGGR